MTPTYILVDFENVQPTDMGLLTGEQYQLRIFRGPHQKKMDFDIAASIQPLGQRVKYIQSDKAGKNALDFHIAFHMGRLIEEVEAKGTSQRSKPNFVVISHDGGFEALLSHLRTLGYGAIKAASIREALELAAVAQPAKKSTKPEESAPATTLAKAVKQTKNSKASTATKKAEKAPPVAKAVAAKSKAAARKSLGREDKDKVIEHLRHHHNKRPVKRQTLENHIQSLLGSNVTAKAVHGLVAMLENEGIIKFEGQKIIEYKMPKIKKVKGENGG
jgi:hypothetical protein